MQAKVILESKVSPGHYIKLTDHNKRKAWEFVDHHDDATRFDGQRDIDKRLPEYRCPIRSFTYHEILGT